MLFSFKKELVINYLYYSLGFIIPGILSFLFIPFVMRSYGAGVYAQYSIAFNTLNTVSAFCYGWVGHGYIRFYSTNSTNLYSTAVKLLIKSLLLGLIVFTGIIFFVADISFADYCLLMPAYFLSGLYSFSLMICYAKQKARLVAVAETVRTIISVFVPFIVFLFLGNLQALPVLLLSLMLSYIMPLIIVMKNAGIDHSIFKKGVTFIYNTDTAKKLTGYGLPLALFFSFLMALMVNDRFVIARLLSYTASGNYAALYDAVNKAVTFATAPIAFTFHAHIVKQYNDGNKKGAYASVGKALALQLGIFIAGFILLYVAGPLLLALLFKNDIPVGYMQMAYFIYAGVFVLQMAVIVHKPLELKMQTKHLARGIILAFIFNVAANYILIGQFKSVFVAAYTTLGASIIYLVYVAFFSIKRSD